MFGSLLRDRRIMGRSGRARFHSHEAPGGRVGAHEGLLLAGASKRNGEPERRAYAMANRQRAIAGQPVRRASARVAGLGCRAVPRPGNATRPVEHRL